MLKMVLKKETLGRAHRDEYRNVELNGTYARSSVVKGWGVDDARHGINPRPRLRCPLVRRYPVIISYVIWCDE